MSSIREQQEQAAKAAGVCAAQHAGAGLADRVPSPDCGDRIVGAALGSSNKYAGEQDMAKESPRIYTALDSAMKLIEEDRAHRSLRGDQTLMMRVLMPQVAAGLHQLAQGINSWMRHQGFWASDNKGEKLALIHSEVSECLEAVRKGDHNNEGEEMADTVIRILDYCAQFNIPLAYHIEQKMYANYQRPYRHGKAF